MPSILPVIRLLFVGLCDGWVVRSLSRHITTGKIPEAVGIPRRLARSADSGTLPVVYDRGHRSLTLVACTHNRSARRHLQAPRCSCWGSNILISAARPRGTASSKPGTEPAPLGPRDRECRVEQIGLTISANATIPARGRKPCGEPTSRGAVQRADIRIVLCHYLKSKPAQHPSMFL